jgi:hypothetical protein
MDVWVPGSCLTGEEGLRFRKCVGQAPNAVTYLLLKLSIVWLGPPGWPSPRFVSFCISLALDRLIEARSFENEALRLSLPYYKTSGRDTGGSRHEPVNWYVYRCHSIENSWYRYLQSSLRQLIVLSICKRREKFVINLLWYQREVVY